MTPDHTAILADCERAEKLTEDLSWATLFAVRAGLRSALSKLAPVLAAHCRALIAKTKEWEVAIGYRCQCRFVDGEQVDECHLHACQRHVLMENGDPSEVTLEDRVAELEAGILPGQFYMCGCPARKSDKIKAFCPTHHSTLRDATAGEVA